MSDMSMQVFEASLNRYTAIESREVLGAIGLVVDREGIVRYHHAGGQQSLDENAQALDKESVFELGSAGKLFTHIAALQCVEQGLIGLDDPVEKHLPELASLKIVIRETSSDADDKQKISLQENTTPITLRHLLTHTSGVGDPSDPLLAEWHAQNPASSEQESSDSVLLLFTPGTGWNYGSSINWTSKLVAKLSGMKLPDYVEKHVFKPLAMDSSTFAPLNDSTVRPDLHARRMPLVIRQAGSNDSKTQLIVPKRSPVLAPATTASDYGKLLTALMSKSPSVKILSEESIDLLFTGQLSSKPLVDLRADTETYIAPTGLSADVTDPKVNFTAAGGVVIEETIPLSGFPRKTLTWNGAPNVIWSVNREIGKAAVFATQLFPVDDEVAVELAMAFFKDVWSG